MGSHRRYTNRYPPEFDVFHIGDIAKNISKEKKRTIAEYDNSILYNDFICNEIIKRFEDKNAIIFLFPDHGEEVYDERNMCGHSEYNPSKGMVNIPFYIWTSSKFKRTYSNTEELLRQSTSNPFCTTNLIHTIMDICSIDSKDCIKNNSLLFQTNYMKN